MTKDEDLASRVESHLETMRSAMRDEDTPSFHSQLIALSELTWEYPEITYTDVVAAVASELEVDKLKLYTLGNVIDRAATRLNEKSQSMLEKITKSERRDERDFARRRKWNEQECYKELKHIHASYKDALQTKDNVRNYFIFKAPGTFVMGQDAGTGKNIIENFYYPFQNFGTEDGEPLPLPLAAEWRRLEPTIGRLKEVVTSRVAFMHGTYFRIQAMNHPEDFDKGLLKRMEQEQMKMLREMDTSYGGF